MTHTDFADDQRAPLALVELSQELEEVEWLGASDPAAGTGSMTFMRRGDDGPHLADHWSFELSLAGVGALMGVALYFWFV